MPQQIIIDSRLPTSDLPITDPANPRNIIRNSTQIMNQATADTRYDATPPARIEAFTNMYEFYTSYKVYIIILLTLVALYLLIIPRPLYQKIALAFVAIYSLHYLASLVHH